MTPSMLHLIEEAIGAVACKEDRPSLAALKSISRKMAEQRHLVECRYFHGQACNCDGRGYCVCEAA